jgi:hypothetical protein
MLHLELMLLAVSVTVQDESRKTYSFFKGATDGNF